LLGARDLASTAPGGRPRHLSFFEESLNERAQQRRQLEADLRSRSRAVEFELVNSPVDLEQNRICSFEALPALHHPSRA